MFQSIAFKNFHGPSNPVHLLRKSPRCSFGSYIRTSPLWSSSITASYFQSSLFFIWTNRFVLQHFSFHDHHDGHASKIYFRYALYESSSTLLCKEQYWCQVAVSRVRPRYLEYFWISVFSGKVKSGIFCHKWSVWVHVILTQSDIERENSLPSFPPFLRGRKGWG